MKGYEELEKMQNGSVRMKRRELKGGIDDAPSSHISKSFLLVPSSFYNVFYLRAVFANRISEWFIYENDTLENLWPRLTLFSN